MINIDVNKIDAYLDQELNDLEIEEFEEELKINEHLAAELEIQKATREIIVDHELINFKNQIRAFLDKKSVINGKKNRTYKNSIFSGIIIIALFTTVWYLVKNTESVIPEELSNGDIKIEEYNGQKVQEKKQEFAENEPYVKKTDPLTSPESDAKNLHQIRTKKEKFEGADEKNIKSEINDSSRLSIMNEMSDLPVLNRKENSWNTIKSPNPLGKIDYIKIESENCEWKSSQYEIWVTEKCLEGIVHFPKSWIEKVNKQTLSINFSPDYPVVKEDKIVVSKGFYTVKIRDNSNCQLARQIIVEGNNCEDEPNVFSPENGEVFSFTDIFNYNGVINISNRYGKHVRKITFKRDQIVVWEGFDYTNNLVSTGIYYYVALDEHGLERNGGCIYVIR